MLPQGHTPNSSSPLLLPLFLSATSRTFCRCFGPYNKCKHKSYNCLTRFANNSIAECSKMSPLAAYPIHKPNSYHHFLNRPPNKGCGAHTWNANRRGPLQINHRRKPKAINNKSALTICTAPIQGVRKTQRGQRAKFRWQLQSDLVLRRPQATAAAANYAHW